MSAAAQPQSSAKSLPKVLRIGVVQDGKIAQERLIRSGEAVTIGSGPRATFQIPSADLGPSHALFVSGGGSYQLVVPERVEGKISWKDGIRDLSDLRTRGEMSKRGENYVLQLNEAVRGKVAFGNTTLLFQFVNAPPEPVRAVSAADFRPRLFNDDDPLFLGLFGVFNMIAVLFYVAILLSPPVEDNALDHVDDAAYLVVDRVELPPPVVEPQPELGQDEVKPEVEKDAPKADDAPPAPKAEVSADSVAKKSLVLQALGTTGLGTDEFVDNILGNEQAQSGSLSSALDGVSGAQMATADNLGLKSGGKGGSGDAAVGITQANAGTAGTGDGVAVAVKKAKVDVGDGEFQTDEGDPSDIGRVVKGKKAAIETCVQRALKSDPGTDGRVAVGWVVQAGKVSGAVVKKNTTGNPELGECIAKVVRGMRFDASVTATVDEWAWVVSGQ
jgi:hypothetical protein